MYYVLRYTEDGAYNLGSGHPCMLPEATKYATREEAEAVQDDLSPTEIVEIDDMTDEEWDNVTHGRTELAPPLPANGVGVLVGGKVVAWFSEWSEGAQQYCTENHFGQWLTMEATSPFVIPPTAEDLAKARALAADIMKKMVPHADDSRNT